MKFEEIGLIEAPVSDFSSGVAVGIGFGLALIGLGLVC